MIINENDYQRIRFPYYYLGEEVLTDEQVNYRIRLIKISLIMYFTSACFVVPTLGSVVEQIVLPVTPTSIERLIPNQSNQLDSETRNIVKTAPVIKDSFN